MSDVTPREFVSELSALTDALTAKTAERAVKIGVRRACKDVTKDYTQKLKGHNSKLSTGVDDAVYGRVWRNGLGFTVGVANNKTTGDGFMHTGRLRQPFLPLVYWYELGFFKKGAPRMTRKGGMRKPHSTGPSQGASMARGWLVVDDIMATIDNITPTICAYADAAYERAIKNIYG